MWNDRLEKLGAGPFDRLRSLLTPIEPPAGVEPIVMSIGEPAHPYPEFVGEVMHANRHLYDKYPPILGTAEYRLAVADWLTRRYDLPAGMIEPDRHIVPLAGTREGLFLMASVVVPETTSVGGRNMKPAVLLPNPMYQVYLGAAVFSGADPVYVPCTRETGFLPDLSQVPEGDLERAAMVFVCTPSNPQGAIADIDQICEMIHLARKHDFLLVVDECYAEVYDTAPPPGALEACLKIGGAPDEIMRNVAIFHSLSKRSSVPGLRVGFAAGDPEIMAKYAMVRAYSSAQVPLPVYAAGAALWRDEEHVVTNRKLYREKFDIAERVLGGRFDFYRPEGGFFLWLNVGDGEEATLRLWRDAGLRVAPGGYLSRTDANGVNPGDAYIRVALVLDAAKTEIALQRIADTLGR